MDAISPLSARLAAAVDRGRLLDTAMQLVAAPSRTGEAGAALDCLARLLTADGFTVERPAAGHPAAPAVVVRFDGGRPGRTLQFNGHLDTVHLPFVPPAVEGGRLTGSGASDMKGGTAAAVEALRVLRDTGALAAGSVLLTAHDLHEAPWGLGQQLDRLIADGCVGDGVLLPEPLCDRLPAVGRGAMTWKATIRREEPPVHEVMRPPGVADVIAAGADLVGRLGRLNERLSARLRSDGGQRESLHRSNPRRRDLQQYRRRSAGWKGRGAGCPAGRGGKWRTSSARCWPGWSATRGVKVAAEIRFIRDAFRLDLTDPLTTTFQRAYAAVSGSPLPVGPKPFVDDGNSFYGLRGLPAITHGPRAGGQHTVQEWVEIDDLVRVAHLYALTAAVYCGSA